MKITVVMGFFLPVPAAAGGATEKSWEGLARAFAAQGHEVTVISRQWPGWPTRETVAGVCHLRLRGHAHTQKLIANLWWDFIWSWRVWFSLPAADVTIVNCVALPVWLGWLRRRSGSLVVMPGRMPKGQYRLYRRVDRVLVGSSSLADAVAAENPGLAAATRVLGCPIDHTALAAGAGVRGAVLTIGFVGRIHREKGIDLLVASLRLLAARSDLPPWRVFLCGPVDVARGGSGESYAAEVRETINVFLPSNRFELRSPVFEAKALSDVYREIDVFCYPSLAARGETFGVAVAEAMAAGAVPVVSKLPCFTDFVEPGVSGETFDHSAKDAPAQLAAALGRLLSDHARRHQMAQAAREAVRRYDFPHFAATLLADFSTLK